MNTSRRNFLTTSALASAAVATGVNAKDKTTPDNGGVVIPDGRIKLSLKIGMARVGGNDLDQKFRSIQKLGYDGIELNSPGGFDKKTCRAAADKLNFPIHGVVNSIHWRTHFSDPSAEVRQKALEGLITCLKDTQTVGGNSVLIVPGVVNNKVTHQQVWDRSIETIQKAIPMAAAMGIHILLENVWNGFLYDKKGDNKQSADLIKNYIDEMNSPWFGSYFDIGNHQRFGKPEEWIKTLGRRIVKLDVKDWGIKTGFAKIGHGDVNWKEVRKSLLDINYSGWATAEVGGGDEKRCAEVLQNMRTHVLGK